MMRLKRILSGILLSFCSVYAGEVCIIGTADIHGDMAAFARLAPVIKQYPLAVKVDAGDLIQGGYAATLLQGRPMFEVLDLLGYDVFVPGNHEFEFDSRIFSLWQKCFQGRIAGVQWKFGEFVPAEYVIVSRNGFRIGIVGATDANISDRQGFYPQLHFTDTVAALTKSVQMMRREKVDAVVLVCHIALQGSFGMIYRILQEVPEIDAVISCHSHREHPGEIISGRIVAQPGAYGSSAVLLKLHFSAEKKVEFVTSSLLRPAESPDLEVMRIYREAQKMLRGGNFRKNFSDLSDFGSAAARALRTGCRTDAAVCRFAKKYFRREVDGETLFRMLPYGNRMAVVKVGITALQEFVRRCSNEKYECFADIAPGADGMVTAAVPDYLLWNDPEWKNLDRRIISLFERETIVENLDKSR